MADGVSVLLAWLGANQVWWFFLLTTRAVWVEEKTCDKRITASLLRHQAKLQLKLRFPLQSSVAWVKRRSANWPSENLHDGHVKQSRARDELIFSLRILVLCKSVSTEEFCDHLIKVPHMVLESYCSQTVVWSYLKTRWRISKLLRLTRPPITTKLMAWLKGKIAQKYMLGIYWWQNMDNWSKHLPQIMRAYNSTERSTMMLTRHKKALPLTFFYPEREKKIQHRETFPRAHQKGIRNWLKYGVRIRSRQK